VANLVNNLGGAAGFGEQNLTRNDDSFQSAVSLTSVFGAQGLNFFGTSYTQISINNNGNITFGGGGLSTYTPFALQSGGVPIIAPFFADVDTRLNVTGTIGPNNVTPTPGGNSRGSDLVWYDFDTAAQTLTVTWDDVGYYSVHTDKLNAFQLQLIGTGNGNFQAVIRYEASNWVTGDASGGSGGLGGTVARAGFATGRGDLWYELPQSGNQNGMLTIEDTAGNTGAAGFYRFNVKSGTSLAEVIDGTNEDDVISAGGGNDTVNGLAGNDTLDGGTGADRLVGGAGNNSYVVDNQLDTVVEAANAGNDTVLAAISYTLGSNLENLILTGSALIDALGNDLDNLLYGNAGNNTINGLSGSDTVSYINATSGVTVSLAVTAAQFIGGGQGSDTLVSIENIVGSISSDTLTGNTGANVLNGNGGTDTMRGGGGADIYYVDNTSDSVVETDNTPSGSEGFGLDLDLATTIDTVVASVNYSLSSFVENLTLAEGALNLTGTGNTLSNVITGNAGNNTLNGGTGNDILRGGDGTDTAVFSQAIGNYQFGSKTVSGVTSTVVSGPDGQDVLQGVEFAQFGGATPVAVSSLGPFKPLVSVYRFGETFYEVATPFSGTPIPGIQIDYQFLGGESGEVSTGTDSNDFFNLLAGDDAAAGGAGADILDGGIGSNFLSGNEGTDTFFLDGRGGTVTWSTITDWSASEQLSVWGWNANSRVILWRQDGATGFQGITMHADLNNDGTIDTSVTWTGKTQAELPTPGEFFNEALLWFK
jgi:Ca2+-binding RTX toxin-like protein